MKHTTFFPFNSINFCLNYADIDISQVDVISINSNPFSSFLKKFFFIIKNPTSYPIALKSMSNIKVKDIKI